jgi:hypothetical protein
VPFCWVFLVDPRRDRLEDGQIGANVAVLRLSKSRYVAGLQCRKMLWWMVHEPEAAELVADGPLNAIFERGQREGRVDRGGWGRLSEGYIDVRFLLLKGTYEERIFHTVMQRDQWFQILIGSKKRELGTLPEAVEDEVGQDQIEEDLGAGALTESEKRRVMLDLRPE